MESHTDCSCGHSTAQWGTISNWFVVYFLCNPVSNTLHKHTACNALDSTTLVVTVTTTLSPCFFGTQQYITVHGCFDFIHYILAVSYLIWVHTFWLRSRLNCSMCFTFVLCSGESSMWWEDRHRLRRIFVPESQEVEEASCAWPGGGFSHLWFHFRLMLRFV